MKRSVSATHKPFTQGACLDCHDPHGSNQKAMLVKDEKSLCLKCHAQTGNKVASAKTVHGAFTTGACTKCHGAHGSNLKSLLLAKGSDLCLTCHKPIKDRMGAGTAHPPTDDCLNCHKPHESAEPTLLAQPVTELCQQCHDFKAASFTTPHLGIDAKVLKCMSCHDAHGSKDAKLFKTDVHPPFEARQCDSCHVVETKK
jgi:predicted CXXCH cytochrome family protein